MSDLLQRGAEFLARNLKAYASRTVEYRRGATNLTGLAVTLGKSLLKTTNEFGDLQMIMTDRDYLFAAADLILNGVRVTPEKGDIIADSTSGVTNLYEALSLPNEPAWRYCDGHEQIIRLHTKRIGVE